MQSVQLVFTHRNWNPVSAAIRCALPRSILRRALSSHVIIVLPDASAAEANMLHGTRRTTHDIAFAGLTGVAIREFAVPNLDAGIRWLDGQIGKPYDWAGAFGLVDPDRDWQKDDAWFCYELAAAFLLNCGLDLFLDRGHITERELLGINPRIGESLRLAASPL